MTASTTASPVRPPAVRTARAPGGARPDFWLSGRLRRDWCAALVALELVAGTAVVAAARGGRVGVGLALPVLVAVPLLAAARIQQTWAPVWLAIALSYRRRRPSVAEAARLHAPAEDVLLRGGRISAFVDRTGTAFGVLHSGPLAGVTLRVEAARADVLAPAGADLPLAALPWALGEQGADLHEARLVVHEAGEQAVPSAHRRRVSWLCLGIDPARCPGAVEARGGGVAGGVRALTAQAARLAVRCGELDVRLVPLDADALRDAIALCATLPPATVDDPAPAYGEAWQAWNDGGSVHRTYWVERMPPQLTPDALLDLLAGAPVVSVTVSLAVRRAGGLVTRRMLLRVCSAGSDAHTLDGELTAELASAGVRLVPLRGQQLAGVGETLPVVLTT